MIDPRAIRFLLFSGRCARAQPGERGLAFEEEHPAELDAARDLAAARALIQPALPGLRTFRWRQLGDELVECQRPRRWRFAAGRYQRAARQLLGYPRSKRLRQDGNGLRGRRGRVYGVGVRRDCLRPLVQRQLLIDGGFVCGPACHERPVLLGTITSLEAYLPQMTESKLISRIGRECKAPT